VNDVKKTIGATEERVTYLVGDISQENICISLIEHTIKVFGRIDVLVNNAGIGGASKRVQELTSMNGITLSMSTSREHSCVCEKQ